MLVCAGVLFTNVSVWLARELVRELTRDDGLYLPEVHAHPLVYDATLSRHWCDLCGTPIRRGGAWRCKLCDYDLCVPCASRTDAATVGEHVLRGDRGARREANVSSSSYLRRAISLAAGQKGLLFVALALLACNSALALALPKYQGRIVDRVVRQERGAFRNAVVQYLYLMVAQGLCQAAYQAAFSVVSRNILFGVRTTLFKSVIRQDTAFFDGTTSGHLTSRLTNDAQVMMAPIQASLASLLSNSIMLIGGVTMCFATSYELSMLAFVVVGPIMYLWDLYGNWSKSLSRRVLAAWAEANAVATEALHHIRTVKAFVTEDTETKKYDEACGEALRLGIRDALGFGLTSALTGYLDLGTGVLILWVGGRIVLRGDGSLTIGELVTFQLYWTTMNAAYQALQGLVTSFTRSAAAAPASSATVISRKPKLSTWNPSAKWSVPTGWDLPPARQFSVAKSPIADPGRLSTAVAPAKPWSNATASTFACQRSPMAQTVASATTETSSAVDEPARRRVTTSASPGPPGLS